MAEFEEEKQNKDAREKIKAVRKIVHAEMLDTPTRENSTLVNQVAKRLMRLTLGALLLSGGEALSFPHQSSAQCLVAMESTSSSLPWTTMLVTLVFILVVTIIVLIKIMHVMHLSHLRIEATREAMDWVRQQLRQRRDRVRIRGEEQQRLGVWLETDCENSSRTRSRWRQWCSDGEDPHVNGRVAHIRRMTNEEFYNGAEEEMESEMEEVEVEVDPTGSSAGAAGTALAPAASSMAENDFDFDSDSISMDGANLRGGDDGYVSQNDMEQEEEKDDIETDYGSLVGIDEHFSVFENLDVREYDDYRFLLFGEGRGVGD